MCRHVVVVEAGLKSGALGTARHAVEQGRGLHTFPWGLAHPTGEGCHRLIASGSGVVHDVEAFVADLTDGRPIEHPDWLKKVYDGVPLERVSKETGRSFKWILGELGARVARGEVERFPGQRYAPAGPMKMHREHVDFRDSAGKNGSIL